jgi:hypothetical protein
MTLRTVYQYGTALTRPVRYRSETSFYTLGAKRPRVLIEHQHKKPPGENKGRFFHACGQIFQKQDWSSIDNFIRL